MKTFGLTFIFAFTVVCLLFQQVIYGQQLPNLTNKEILIFEGEVEKIGTSPDSVSGGIEVYQLAKYKINRVVRGNYSEKSVIVDHLLLTGNELNRIKVGQKVCISVRKETKIGDIWSDEILRRFSDEISIFYVGNIFKNFKNSPCDKK